MEIGAIYKECVQQLTELYGVAEAESMTSILFEDLLGISKIDRIRHGARFLSSQDLTLLTTAQEKLKKYVPIQHITGFTYFLGRKFQVNEGVLIPRQETEELVLLVRRECQIQNPVILDIGTGSGCIPISLALELPGAKVHSLDVSEKALAVAKQNAENLGAKAEFHKLDILKEDWLSKIDILVSNPPYIPENEKSSMNRNVTGFEPGLALFVPENDPLIFYRRIGEVGTKSLTENGRLFVEIHENFGRETAGLFESQGYKNVTIHKDLNGKDRMISASC